MPCSGHIEDRHGEQRCTYCGSMSLDETIRLLRAAGTRFSGSDWKYGWPHKFYIGPGKFYAIHLTEADCAVWNEVAAPLLGVSYQADQEGVKYLAVHAGWQTWGVTQAPRDEDRFGPAVPDWFMPHVVKLNQHPEPSTQHPTQ